jgi:hypothetical protein
MKLVLWFNTFSSGFMMVKLSLGLNGNAFRRSSPFRTVSVPEMFMFHEFPECLSDVLISRYALFIGSFILLTRQSFASESDRCRLDTATFY